MWNPGGHPPPRCRWRLPNEVSKLVLALLILLSLARASHAQSLLRTGSVGLTSHYSAAGFGLGPMLEIPVRGTTFATMFVSPAMEVRLGDRLDYACLGAGPPCDNRSIAATASLVGAVRVTLTRLAGLSLALDASAGPSVIRWGSGTLRFHDDPIFPRTVDPARSTTFPMLTDFGLTFRALSGESVHALRFSYQRVHDRTLYLERIGVSWTRSRR